MSENLTAFKAAQKAVYGEPAGRRRPITGFRLSPAFARQLWGELAVLHWNEKRTGRLWGVPWRIDPELSEGFQATYEESVE